MPYKVVIFACKLTQLNASHVNQHSIFNPPVKLAYLVEQISKHVLLAQAQTSAPHANLDISLTQITNVPYAHQSSIIATCVHLQLVYNAKAFTS